MNTRTIGTAFIWVAVKLEIDAEAGNLIVTIVKGKTGWWGQNALTLIVAKQSKKLKVTTKMYIYFYITYYKLNY